MVRSTRRRGRPTAWRSPSACRAAWSARSRVQLAAEHDLPQIAPALASGNTVVMKPSELAPLTGVRLFELLLEAGFPPGTSTGSTARRGPRPLARRAPGDRLLHLHRQRPRRRVDSRAGRPRPLVLELGSISPTIVCEDADSRRAAARCAASAFRRAGQVCTSTQRLIVHRSVEPEFRARLTAAAAALAVGDPRDPRTDVGPMISEREAARAEAGCARPSPAAPRSCTAGPVRGRCSSPRSSPTWRPRCGSRVRKCLHQWSR